MAKDNADRADRTARGIREMFDAVADTEGQVPGGCDHCNAHQTLKAPDPQYPGLVQMTVHHDDHCPHLAAINFLSGRKP